MKKNRMNLKMMRNRSQTRPCWKKYLVLVRLIHQMSGLSLGVVVVLRHNPVTDFVLVHLPVFVQVSKVGELLPLSLDPVRLGTPILMSKHVGWKRGEIREWRADIVHVVRFSLMFLMLTLFLSWIYFKWICLKSLCEFTNILIFIHMPVTILVNVLQGFLHSQWVNDVIKREHEGVNYSGTFTLASKRETRRPRRDEWMCEG